MITGWLSDPSGAAAQFLTAMLPEPHEMSYKSAADGLFPSPEATKDVLKVELGGSIDVIGGTDSCGLQALEVNFSIREVFNVIIFDSANVDLTWNSCAPGQSVGFSACSPAASVGFEECSDASSVGFEPCSAAETIGFEEC